jgi:hypothetical protein
MQGIIINIHRSSCKVHIISVRFYLLTDQQTTQCLEPVCLNSDSHTGMTANGMGMKKKIVYILHVSVEHWHAKDTEPRVIMFLMTKDLENMRVNGLISR